MNIGNYHQYTQLSSATPFVENAKLYIVIYRIYDIYDVQW